MTNKKILTLGDLKDIITALEKNGKNMDTIVEIVLSEPSLGPLAASAIVGMGIGIDWDMDRVLIFPEEELVRNKIERE